MFRSASLCLARLRSAPPCFAMLRPRSVAVAKQQKKNTLMKPTVAKAFLESMKGLNATLLNTKCNFVRCIKPNAQMECGVYDNK